MTDSPESTEDFDGDDEFTAPETPGETPQSGGEVFTFAVPDGGIGRFDAWLAASCPELSRSRIQGLIEAGMVFLNGNPISRRNAKPTPGDVAEIRLPPPVPAEPLPEDIPLSIVYEDSSVLVIDKPAGLVVHPAPGHASGTLVNAILHHCPGLSGIGGVARPGIVHRLDMDTSGLMVVAKTQQAMASLAHNFQVHDSIRKTYLAIVHGAPPRISGRIENQIGRSPRNRKKMAVVTHGGKRAATEWKTVWTAGGISLVEFRIETGRTHQIRVHAASIGSPVAGDALYGKPALDKKLVPVPQRQMLHAFRLEFPHPEGGRPMAFEAPPPADFAAYASRSP